MPRRTFHYYDEVKDFNEDEAKRIAEIMTRTRATHRDIIDWHGHNDPHTRDCPTCPDGGFVAPYDVDTHGKVIVLRCLKCQSNFSIHERLARTCP